MPVENNPVPRGGDDSELPAVNPRTLAILRWIGGALGILVLAIGAFHAVEQHPPPLPGGPFTLTSSDGRRVSDKDFRGKWQLIYFGYTFCPDVCPLTLSNVSDALAALGTQADRLQPIFITVDPERDTPSVLAAFAGGFDPRIVALTGTPPEIAAVERSFRVYAAKLPNAKDPGGYLMNHTSLFYLMDPEGRPAALLPASDEGPKLAAALAPYLGRAQR